MRGVSVIIPVYNSADILQDLLLRLELVVKELGTPCELVLVNDGSQDQSWAVVVEASRRLAWGRGINLMRNYGQHNALLCGIREARHDVIVTMDDDLQNPPEEIPKLMARLSDGDDVVYGTPERERHGFWRDMASRITKMALQSA